MATKSMKALLPLATIIIPFAPGPALAQHMNAADAPCRKAGSGAEQAACLSKAAEKADADLSDAYRRIISVLGTSDRQRLQGVGHIWIKYRDQACAAERDLYDGGTGSIAAYPACMEAMTRHQIVEIKFIYWWKVQKFGS